MLLKPMTRNHVPATSAQLRVPTPSSVFSEPFELFNIAHSDNDETIGTE
jgi:hypothetical protein